MEQRLQKLLASAGIASRRASEALISAGRVTVNGILVTEPGSRADPEVDDIRLDGKPIGVKEPPVYILLNKPLGYVATVRDPHAKQTVMDLVKGVSGRLYPVGRLDADSAGLLILTNDGGFTERLTHPSHQVPKTYRVVARGEISAWAATDLRQGLLLEDGMTAPAEVVWVDYDRENNASIVDITIHEGRNRQVRRMFAAIGYPVLALSRTRIGPIELKGLPPGAWRKLRSSEVKALLACVDSLPPSLPRIPTEETSEEPAREARRTTDKSAKGRAGGALREEAERLNRRLRESSGGHSGPRLGSRSEPGKGRRGAT
jgi:23S rRNA pseudouridine2605 synthase